jgi:hypothetical protein
MGGRAGVGRLARAALLPVAVHVGGARLAAQSSVQADTTVPAGTVVGSVVAAQTGAPLDGATVFLEPGPGGVLSAADGNSSFWSAGRAVRTDANGSYRFDGLAVGRYQLHVRRLGYRPASLEIDLQGQALFRVSVGLVVVPIALEPLEVHGVASPPVAALRVDADAAERARLLAETDRRNRFLTSDTRSLSGADVTEAITLGETDLFRALQRLPGVATRDDYTAELWTRGGRWSDTRVTFDGLPLFSPVHVAGAFAGVEPDAVGSAFFHPGVRPASSGEGAAATLDLASRPATDPGLHGLAELSVVSGRAALEHGSNGSGIGWMLAARRSYVDLAGDVLASIRNDSSLAVPYAFTDVAGRVDVPLGSARALEVSGLRAQDVLRGSLPNLLRGNQGHWGDAALQATLVTPLAGLAARFTAGVSRFDLSVVFDSLLTGRPDVPYHTQTRSDISYRTLGITLAPPSGEGWTAGLQVVSQRLQYSGPDPTNHPDSALLVPPPRAFSGATNLVAVWGERRWHPVTHLTLLTGMRIEPGHKVAGAPEARIAPRIQTRYTLGNGALTLSAGYGRSFQYAQAVGPTGPGVGPQLHLSDVWLMAGDTVPAIRSDVTTVGAEDWIGGAWVAALNVYRRRATGVAEPDPTPGPYPRLTRPIFVPAVNAATGAEASVRKLTGRWTASLALAVSRSDMATAGYRYPAPNNRSRVLHGTVLWRAGSGLRVGSAVTVASGAAFTRFVGSHDSTPATCADTTASPCYVEAPSGARAPGYTTVDLLLDWTHAYRRWSLAAYLQLRNALNASNAVVYAGSVDRCLTPAPPTKIEARPGVCDYYMRSVPRLPFAGVRVSF